MRLEVGTILEPKFDNNIEHAIIVSNGVAAAPHYNKTAYCIETIKTKQRAFVTEDEIRAYYDPIGQSEVGKALFGNNKSTVGCGNDCVDCKCNVKLGDKL